ncbi:hypothetical protein OSTOST_11705 [Ostertagia ostertagi]
MARVGLAGEQAHLMAALLQRQAEGDEGQRVAQAAHGGDQDLHGVCVAGRRPRVAAGPRPGDEQVRVTEQAGAQHVQQHADGEAGPQHQQQLHGDAQPAPPALAVVSHPTPPRLQRAEPAGQQRQRPQRHGRHAECQDEPGRAAHQPRHAARREPGQHEHDDEHAPDQHGRADQRAADGEHDAVLRHGQLQRVVDAGQAQRQALVAPQRASSRRRKRFGVAGTPDSPASGFAGAEGAPIAHACSRDLAGGAARSRADPTLAHVVAGAGVGAPRRLAADAQPAGGADVDVAELGLPGPGLRPAPPAGH